MAAKFSQLIEYRDIEMSDLDTIYDLETKSYNFPWTRNILKDCIINRYDSFAAMYSNNIVGYVISKISSIESHILNLTVDEKYGFKKIGLRKNYYKTSLGKEDAIVYRKILN